MYTAYISHVHWTVDKSIYIYGIHTSTFVNRHIFIQDVKCKMRWQKWAHGLHKRNFAAQMMGGLKADADSQFTKNQWQGVARGHEGPTNWLRHHLWDDASNVYKPPAFADPVIFLSQMSLLFLLYYLSSHFPWRANRVRSEIRICSLALRSTRRDCPWATVWDSNLRS